MIFLVLLDIVYMLVRRSLWLAGDKLYILIPIQVELASQFTLYALIPVAKGIFDNRESG